MLNTIITVCNQIALVDITILITMLGTFVILAALKPDEPDVEWHAKPFRD